MNNLGIRRSAALAAAGLSVLAAGLVSAPSASAGVTGPGGLSSGQQSMVSNCSWSGGGDTFYYQCKVSDSNGIRKIVATEAGELKTTNVAGCVKSTTYTAFYTNTKTSKIQVTDCKGNVETVNL